MCRSKKTYFYRFSRFRSFDLKMRGEMCQPTCNAWDDGQILWADSSTTLKKELPQGGHACRSKKTAFLPFFSI